MSNRANVTAGTKNSADIIAVIGASGTGKSSYIKGELLKRYKRLVIWSPLEATDNYAGFCGGQVVTSRITALVDAIKAGAKAVVYVPTGSDKDVKKQFDLFCRVVWTMPGATVLVEELSRVTMPSWAPPAWKNVSTAGRHQGLKVIATSQRPAQVDKDFFGNCSEIRCFALVYEEDAKTMSKVTRVPVDEILNLPKFHYRHRYVTEKRTVSGVVSVPHGTRK